GLADETEHRRRHRIDIAPARVTARRSVPVQHGANARQLLRELPHPVVLAQLPPFDGAFVVTILLPPARVEAPRLNGRTRTGRDVDVAPSRRNALRVDALERSSIADR